MVAPQARPNAVDETDPQVEALRRHCGGGPIVNVAEPQSERLFRSRTQRR